MADIKIIRALGIYDDIIAKVERKGKNRYALKDACNIRIDKVQTEDKSEQTNVQFQIMLSPFLMPYMKQEQTVELDVLFVAEPEEQVIAKYNSLFSPIITPSLSVNKQPSSGIITSLK
jgi:hypothetical protein